MTLMLTIWRVARPAPAYGRPPQSRRSLRGWRKVWNRIDVGLLLVRRTAIWTAAGIFVFAPLRPGWGIWIH